MKKKCGRSFYFLQIPEIVHSIKWKYDYLLLKKTFLDVVAIPFKRISSDAKVLLKAFPTSIQKVYYGRVVRRSGLGNFKGIFAFNGTVYSEYRGNVCVF